MVPGERAALEGILAAVRPTVSIEIGTHKGGSLERISANSSSVHTFDLDRYPEVTPERFPNVTFHIGDSHELLPQVLEQLAASETNVDFALVDGDHSAPGVRRDVEDLLSSRSVGRTVILLHDTLCDRVRAGLELVDYGAFEKVRFVDLDFVPGRVMADGPQANELWCGLGLIVAGWDLVAPDNHRAYSVREVYDAFSSALGEGGLNDQLQLGYGQLLQLEEDLARQKRLLGMMERSWSWRLTAPLRGAKRLVRHGR